MNNRRAYKALLLLLALGFFLGAAQTRQWVARQRAGMGFRQGTALQDAPPMLNFVTVALGGFRGLIANVLWMRATELQDQDRYFEMVQLADWITKLEPRLKQVWIVQAWNMAYNISVKFTEPADRWRWVQRGIELLRDEALRYSPDEALLYRELAWFFQHKMGQILDDAHQFYKRSWCEQMTAVLGPRRDSYLELIDPQTEDARARARRLRTQYKMDPAKMREVDRRYGPLEWRLPEAHAIYWGALGLEKSRPADLITLRRIIYQSMQLAFQRGRLVAGSAGGVLVYGPNLDLIPRVSAAYEEMIRETDFAKDNIQRAHRNFLRQAVFHLYTHNRLAEAERWFKYLRELYPDDGEVKAAGGDLDTYAIRKVTEGVGDGDLNKTKSLLEGFLRTAYLHLALDDEDRAAGFLLLARKVWRAYQSKITPAELARTGLPDFPRMQKQVQEELLDVERGFEAPYRAVLRTKLGLPPEAPAPGPAPPSR